MITRHSQRKETQTSVSEPARAALAPRGFGPSSLSAGIAAHSLSALSVLTPQAKLTVNQPGDKYEQEADSVADSVMRMGDTDAVQREEAEEDEEKIQMKPLAGAISPLAQRAEKDDEEEDGAVQAKALPGVSPLVQRAGEDEEEEGVQAQRKETGGLQSADVSGVVSQGLSGGGQPLDDATRAFMEPRFGHDFSQVRIHTDSRASESSEQIAARAYTVGSDIAFRSGEFSPGTGDGKRLLAHELAHVVQQTGAAQKSSQEESHSFRVPRLKADADAKGPVRSRLNGASLVQAAEAVPTPTWGTKPGGGSHVDFEGFASMASPDPRNVGFQGIPFSAAVMNVYPGTTGQVQYDMLASWKVINLLLDDTGFATYKTAVPFSVSDEGVVAWFPAIPGEQTTTGTGASLVLPVPVVTATTATGGYVNVAPVISHTASGSIGGGIGVGPISISQPYTANVNKADALTKSYTVDLNVVKEPQKPINLDPPLSFKVNSASLEDGQEGAFSKWFLGQPATVQDAVRQGKRAINISAYASTTGKRHKNRLLSQQRATTAQFILRGFAGSAANINPFYFGEDAAHTPDEKEDPKERRTEVSILPSGTAAAPAAAGK